MNGYVILAALAGLVVGGAGGYGLCYFWGGSRKALKAMEDKYVALVLRTVDLAKAKVDKVVDDIKK